MVSCARHVAIVVASIVASGGRARADDLATVEQRGRDAAKDGKFSEPIDAFKEADRLAPRASHACLIALAYTRRERWPQAEIFFTLADHLASANVAEVEIRVEPAAAKAMPSVSSFANDQFGEVGNKKRFQVPLAPAITP